MAMEPNLVCRHCGLKTFIPSILINHKCPKRARGIRDNRPIKAKEFKEMFRKEFNKLMKISEKNAPKKRVKSKMQSKRS